MKLNMNEKNVVIEECPIGNHTIQCFAVIDLGLQGTSFGPKHMIKIGWETEKKIKEGPEWAIGKPFGFYKTLTLSANKKSNLMKLLNNWIIDLDAEVTKNSVDNKLDLPSLLIGRYGTGVVGKEKWNDGEMHTTLKSIIPANEDHPKWDLINGPNGSEKEWRYPKNVRQKRAEAIEPPDNYPNQYDEDNNKTPF